MTSAYHLHYLCRPGCLALGPNAQMVGLPLDIIQLSKYLRKAVQLGSVWFNVIFVY